MRRRICVYVRLNTFDVFLKTLNTVEFERSSIRCRSCHLHSHLNWLQSSSLFWRKMIWAPRSWGSSLASPSWPSLPSCYVSSPVSDLRNSLDGKTTSSRSQWYASSSQDLSHHRSTFPHDSFHLPYPLEHNIAFLYSLRAPRKTAHTSDRASLSSIFTTPRPHTDTNHRSSQ
jgi:hypothetical protein